MSVEKLIEETRALCTIKWVGDDRIKRLCDIVEVMNRALEYCANGPKPYTLEGFRTKAKGALRDADKIAGGK